MILWPAKHGTCCVGLCIVVKVSDIVLRSWLLNRETPEDDWLGMKWKGFLSPRQMSRIKPTGVPVDILRSIGVRASTLPADAHPHKQIATIFKKRLAAIEVGKGLDWGTAEALAFGSLLLEVCTVVFCVYVCITVF